MKRATIISVLFLTATTLAFSVERMEKRGQREMAEYLQLTAAQQTAWDNAHADFRNATRTLVEKRSAFGREAEGLLKEKSSDACRIGALTISIQTINDQVRTEENALQQKVLSTLTPDQKTKYEAFRAAQGQVFERSSVPRD
jgi:Spy/CpxP family protein refolding chaperone